MKSCGRHRRRLLAFQISALDGGEWRASRPSYFTHAERSLGTHSVGARVDHSIKMDVLKQQVINYSEKNLGV
jgi:hypothetical protein